MQRKERLDVLLVQQGLLDTREKAQKRIMAGEVLVNDQRIDKCGTKVAVESRLRLLGKDMPYVSRGGLKLQEAIKNFNISLNNAVVCDIGASTGGFVDCALQNGAKRVFAVDVGYGQLAWSLRTDERVVNMEKTNARFLESSDFSDVLDWVTTDVSFISLDKILPVAYNILKEEGQMVALIKPQFEAGREHVGKNGVVKDPQIHIKVIDYIIEVACSLGFVGLGLTSSPIKGPKGNIEYLFWIGKGLNATSNDLAVEQVVQEAHQK